MTKNRGPEEAIKQRRARKDFEAASTVQDILAILITRYNDYEALIARDIPHETAAVNISQKKARLWLEPKGRATHLPVGV